MVIAVVRADDGVTFCVDSPDREMFSRSGVGGQEEGTLESEQRCASETGRGNGQEGFDLLQIRKT